MSKKKAIIFTIILTIIIYGICLALMIVKPGGGEISLFHAFSPTIIGVFIGHHIAKFYDRLRRKN